MVLSNLYKKITGKQLAIVSIILSVLLFLGFPILSFIPLILAFLGYRKGAKKLGLVSMLLIVIIIVLSFGYDYDEFHFSITCKEDYVKRNLCKMGDSLVTLKSEYVYMSVPNLFASMSYRIAVGNFVGWYSSKESLEEHKQQLCIIGNRYTPTESPLHIICSGLAIIKDPWYVY